MVYFSEQKDEIPFCGAAIVVYKRMVNFNIVLGLFKFISE